MSSNAMDVGETLLERGVINVTQLEQARGSGGDVLAHLLQNSSVDSDQVMRALADYLGVDFVDLTQTDIALSLLESFPQKLLYRQVLFPIRRDNGSLVVATADPLDFYPLDEISAATGLHVQPVLAERNEIAKLIKTHLGVGGETVGGLIEQKI